MRFTIAAVRATTLSKRYTPRHVSPAATLIVSVAFATSSTVFAETLAMRHVPFKAPAASLISTQ